MSNSTNNYIQSLITDAPNGLPNYQNELDINQTTRIYGTTGQLSDPHQTDERLKKREVYRYQTDWMVSSIAWQNATSESFNLAVSSFRENYKNYVQLVTLRKETYDEEIRCISTFEHPYPATKISWIPRTSTGFPDLIATSADYLRLWRIVDRSNNERNIPPNDDNRLTPHDTQTKVNLETLLNCSQDAKFCAPLTSFDWNEVDPSIIVTSSVDTTCAIWDISVSKVIDTTTSQVSCSPTTNFVSGTLRSQLVAHSNQVNDVSFSKLGNGKDIFVTAGSDGSVRLFDLRRLSTSTVLFDDTSGNAMVRVCCSKQDLNLVSAFLIDSNDILLLDIRKPGRSIARLGNHTGNLNSMSWAPHSAHHICSAADDQQALIWELSKLPNPVDEPLLAYKASGRINVINWSASHNDWIAIGFENYLELLRV